MKQQIKQIIYSIFILFFSFSIFQIFFLHKGSSISPTAHYTSYVWIKNNLSFSNFHTYSGFLLYWILEPLMRVSLLFNGPTIENMLLARHQLIDQRLSKLIETGEITQIIELASGLSGRGRRFSKKYGNNITYIESDFKDMVNLKQKLLENEQLNRQHHLILPINALLEDGNESLNHIIHQYIMNINISGHYKIKDSMA